MPEFVTLDSPEDLDYSERRAWYEAQALRPEPQPVEPTPTDETDD